MDHDIFRTPHRVEPTIEDRETPPSYASYPDGVDLGETLPMWRVQTEGYKEGKGQLIGIVSSDAGFLDSPDVEWISGGVNTKGPRAVALGRHGNFFHWGFAASPTYLTAEAKLVFVNALHYITRFDGEGPLVRKADGVRIRSSVAQAIGSISDTGYARTRERYERLRADREERNTKTRARIEAGEEVSKLDRQMLDMRPIETPGRFKRVRKFISDADWAELDDDPAKVAAYLRDRLPYFRPSGERYGLEVDEELRRFGVGSDDVALLESAVAALDSDEKKDLARTLLERYTTESFETAAEWRTWLATNRARLFFTEAGGYVWRVDTIGERSSAAAKATTPKPRELKPTPDAPLDARLAVTASGGNEVAVTVDVAILDEWHAYDVVPPGVPFIPLTLSLALPQGVHRVGEWDRPFSIPDVSNFALTKFEGTLKFRCKVVDERDERTGGKITCTLRFQVCDADVCLPPMTRELVAALPAPAESGDRVNAPGGTGK